MEYPLCIRTRRSKSSSVKLCVGLLANVGHVASQKQSGKAFEFAVLRALQVVLGENNAVMVESASTKDAAADFDLLEPAKQQENLAAGTAAARFLLQLEPHLALATAGQFVVRLALQSDQSGGAGDVRDVLLSIPEQSWEIGISAKHQHEALKHSRLSKQIDFGSKWFGIPCSTNYFEAIEPIFDRLQRLRQEGRAWAEITNKDTEVYTPILLAFCNEIVSHEKLHAGRVAPGLVSYLIGHQDFYKVIKLKKQTKIQAYNFNGTLNASARGSQPQIRLDKLKLPQRVVELDFRREQSGASTTTLDMICDAGWQLSFRLHNASSRVEPSLKFDINLVGRPNSMQTFTAMWDA